MADWTPAGAPTPLTPTERWKAISKPEPTYMTPEQRYERFVGKLPNPVQAVMPSTMGEAGFLAGGAAATIGSVLAPETFGGSLAVTLPLAGAALGGGLENPRSPSLATPLKEVGKGGLQLLGGKLINVGGELAGRAIGKTGILNRTATRIAQGVTSLFNKYPLNPPLTAEDLENQIASGNLSNAAGSSLGRFRDVLKTRFERFGVAPHVGSSLSGYQRLPNVGQEFLLPDVDEFGKRVFKRTDIAGAIAHVKQLQESGWSPAGTQKGAIGAGLDRSVAHDAREALISQLNAIETGLGNQYAEVSADYGTSRILEDVFKNARRTSRIKGEDVGVLDQPKLLKRINNELPDIGRLQGVDKGVKFRLSISPTGAEAVAEQRPGMRIHAGESGLRSMFHPPIPYKPETRSLLPSPAREISDPRLRALLGYLGLQGAEDILGEKGEQQ